MVQRWREQGTLSIGLDEEKLGKLLASFSTLNHRAAACFGGRGAGKDQRGCTPSLPRPDEGTYIVPSVINVRANQFPREESSASYEVSQPESSIRLPVWRSKKAQNRTRDVVDQQRLFSTTQNAPNSSYHYMQKSPKKLMSNQFTNAPPPTR